MPDYGSNIKENTMAYQTRWYIHAVFYIIIAVLAVILIKVAVIDPGEDIKVNIKVNEDTETDYSEYYKTLDAIYDLNVGDSFDKEKLRSFACNKPDVYQIYIDIKEQTEYESLYEIKGLTENNIGIEWRFYIKTENDYIVSIVKE